jgi:PIN domain nuclease of toxin-antitoxin system
MTFLDTHVAVWLYTDKSLVPPSLLDVIDSQEVALCPMAALEIEYLHEIGRIASSSRTILGFLGEKIGLKVEDRRLAEALLAARDIKWTRDPFDRIIVSHAQVLRVSLITKDSTILQHCRCAIWKQEE